MLDSLKISNFRCFDNLEISSLGRVNLIVGKNNTGKSTVLEAVYVLARNGAADALSSILKDRHEFFSDAVDSSKEASKTGFWGKVRTANNNKEETCIGNLQGTKIVGSEFTAGARLGRALRGEPISATVVDTTSPHAIIRTTLESETKLAELWDEVYLNSEDQFLQDALHILNPNITSLMFVQRPDKSAGSDGTSRRVAVVKLKGEAKAISLKSMGEGISRLLQIFLHAFFARDGYLMIDEFENGLHYSIQEEVLEKLFKLAKELNIQVFMTTHSKDVIKAFSKVSLASPEEGRLISLGRNERESDKKTITALVYNEDDIKLIAETDMEVR